MVLADALSRMTGSPLVAIHDGIWTNVPRHVGVEISPGRYADARGPDLDEEGFLDGFRQADTTIRSIAPVRLREIWGHRIHDWDVPDHELAAMGLGDLADGGYRE